MSGILWAITAGVGFGLFQAFHRRANQLIDAFGATFILLIIATAALGAGSALTQDLSAIGRAPAWAFLAFVRAATHRGPDSPPSRGLGSARRRVDGRDVEIL